MSTMMNGFPNLIRFFDVADNSKQMDLDITALNTGGVGTWQAYSIAGQPSLTMLRIN